MSAFQSKYIAEKKRKSHRENFATKLRKSKFLMTDNSQRVEMKVHVFISFLLMMGSDNAQYWGSWGQHPHAFQQFSQANFFVESKKIVVSDHCNHSLFWCMSSYWWYQVNWGEWNLPMRVCDFYLAMDVVCSTSSIFHLVAISIDRWSQWWVLCHGDYGLRDYDDNKYVPSLRTLSTRPSPLGMWAVGPIIRCKWTNLLRDQLTGGTNWLGPWPKTENMSPGTA